MAVACQTIRTSYSSASPGNCQTRTGQRGAPSIVRRFKKMVSETFVSERTVASYARTMGLTPGHLSDTVKAVTGRPAGQLFLLWLAATHPVAFAIVLLASVLLAVVLLVVLFKFLRKVVRGLDEFFRGRPLPRELG